MNSWGVPSGEEQRVVLLSRLRRMSHSVRGKQLLLGGYVYRICKLMEKNRNQVSTISIFVKPGLLFRVRRGNTIKVNPW